MKYVITSENNTCFIFEDRDKLKRYIKYILDTLENNSKAETIDISISLSGFQDKISDNIDIELFVKREELLDMIKEFRIVVEKNELSPMVKQCIYESLCLKIDKLYSDDKKKDKLKKEISQIILSSKMLNNLRR